mgnify:CR=1 FL=1
MRAENISRELKILLMNPAGSGPDTAPVMTGRRSKIRNSQKTPVLEELAVEDAVGEIKTIYAAIESALSVKLVNLVYRHLATVPGALEWAWGTVGPGFEKGVFARRSRELVLTPVPAPSGSVSLGRAGLSGMEGRAALETIDAYNRANPMNALSLRVIALALETGRPAVWRQPVAGDTKNLPSLLPMTPLDGASDEAMEMLHRLAHLTTGDDRGLVPSLFRHFTVWPALLAELADWLEPLAADGIIEKQVAAVSIAADRIAREIFRQLDSPGIGAVLPDESTRSALLKTVEIFPPTICRMIVIGGLLRSALKP